MPADQLRALLRITMAREQQRADGDLGQAPGDATENFEKHDYP